MQYPVALTEVAIERMIAFLAPLFMIVVPNTEAARAAARDALGAYPVRTDRELRLATLAIAFGFGALDALRLSVGADLTLNQILRLRGNACTLNRAAHLNETKLTKVMLESDEDAVETDMPASAQTADLTAYAGAAMKLRPAASKPAAPPVAPAAPTVAQTTAPVSRQQRRYNERQDEKRRRREQEEARKAAMAAIRAARQTRAAA